MATTTIEDPFTSRGGRGRGRGGRGGGRGGAPGRGRGRGKAHEAEQNGPFDTSSPTMNAGRGKGAGYYGFIPTPTASVGRGGSGPIGQSANRGFAPYGRGRGGTPPSQGVPQNPQATEEASAQVGVPSPIDTPSFPNGYRGQNKGGRGGRARGGWFKGANGDYKSNQFDNAAVHSEASDGSRGGRGWRGGYTPHGGFRGRGRGGFGEQDGGGRGRGQSWRGGRGGRGRGGSGYEGNRAYGDRYAAPQSVIDNLPPTRDMRENIAGPAIVELTAPVVAIVDKPTNIENLQCITSYTWDTKRKPTLIVPGSPRIWVDRAMPFKVAFDSGIRMFHEDAFYMDNESTLIPLFRAVDAMALETESEPTAGGNAEAIDWAAVDFVTDRNNLRKLLRWVRERDLTTAIEVSSPASETSPISPTSDTGEGKEGVEAGAAPEWDPRKDFRIDLQLGGVNTVLMERWAARTREVITPPKGGCRANFEQEHTEAAPGCENGGGHYRIVQYNIGGLKMVVRFEVDACIPATDPTAGDSEDGVERDTSRSGALGNAKSSARQSLNTEDEGSSWGGDSAPEPQVEETAPCAKLETKKTETEEVDFAKEAAMWAGGNDGSWDPLPEPVDVSKDGQMGGKGKEWRTPPPQDLSWDFPEDDGYAWGITPNTTQDEEVEVNGELTIVRSGILLPQSSILELATRSIKYADRTSNEDTFLQVFLTQTPTHVVAIHQNGNFEKIVRKELQSPEFASIAAMEGIRRSIAQFVELLKEIQRLVKEHGTSGRLSLVCEKGKLELFGLGGEEGRLSAVELERFKSSTST